ncbi:hypothetical protein D3C80_1187050 [compost metagenome]
MAMSIVHLLEPIEVERKDSKAFGRLQSRELDRQPTTVQQPSQRVRARRLLQHLDPASIFGKVDCHSDDLDRTPVAITQQPPITTHPTFAMNGVETILGNILIELSGN